MGKYRWVWKASPRRRQFGNGRARDHRFHSSTSCSGSDPAIPEALPVGLIQVGVFHNLLVFLHAEPGFQHANSASNAVVKITLAKLSTTYALAADDCCGELLGIGCICCSSHLWLTLTGKPSRVFPLASSFGPLARPLLFPSMGRPSIAKPRGMSRWDFRMLQIGAELFFRPCPSVP